MKLLAFGEMIFDCYPDGAVLGGAPLNFCAHFVQCGGEGALFSAVGQDEYGKQALSELQKRGVNTAFVARNSFPTGACTVTLDEHKVPSFRVWENVAYDHIPFDPFGAQALEEEGFDVLYFGTLSQRCAVSRATLQAVLARCRFSHVFCDLNLRDGCYDAQSVQNCLSHATILKCSEEEAPRLAAFPVWQAVAKETVAKTARALFSAYPQLQFWLYTQGEAGARIYCRNGETFRVCAEKATAVSTVGAGDSFGAAWLCAYLHGATPMEAARLAAKVSAFVVSCKEAVPAYEIKDFLS